MSTTAEGPRHLRIGYAGDDSFITCLVALLDRSDVELAVTLTGDDDRYTSTVETMSLAAGAKVIRGNPGCSGWNEVNEADLDLLVSAAYGYRIPVDDLPEVGSMLNVHPSFLPEGRGPNPLPYIANSQPSAAGVTIHQIDAEFDTGPIVIQSRLDGLDDRPSLCDLTLAAMALAPVLLTTVVDDLDRYLARAEPQGPGTYWPPVEAGETVIDLTAAPADQIEGAIHRFACQGFSFKLDDGRLLPVETAHYTPARHCFEPGRLLGTLRADLLLSAHGGLIRAFPFRDDTVRSLDPGGLEKPDGSESTKDSKHAD
ncbi:MAG: formyltransferase family protein [Acidimicrobiales bacterium]